MLPSKPRPGSIDISQKNTSLVVSKTISTSKYGKGSPLTPEFNPKSYISLQRKPSKVTNTPEKRIVRVSEMQQQKGHLEEELRRTREQLSATEEERDRAFDELREMKRVAQEANMRLSEAMSTQKVTDIYTEFSSVKESLSNAKQELKTKKKKIECLEIELGKEKELEVKLEEKDASLDKLKKELSNVKASEARANDLLFESKKRIQELEAEIESKKLPSLEAKNPLEEMEFLKNELKLATEAEENSQKAMDDLALALKEVVTEASQMKEKLTLTQEELEQSKGEAEKLKLKLKSIEAKLKLHLDEARKEADRYKNTAERLRLEAEESVLAWNGKETGFVGCIKIAEEEKAAVLEENRNLLQSLRAAETMTKTAKEENNKLRDILKQALNEANVAKGASGIAQAENSHLKDSLAEKDEALNFIIQENENLRINEAATLENIKELKRLLSEASAKEMKSEEKEQGKKLKPQNSIDKEHKDGKKLGKSFSLNLKELKIPHKHKDADEGSKMPNKHNDSNKHSDGDEGPEKEADPLRGSIFDIVESPIADVEHHRKKSSSTCTDDGVTIHSDDFVHLDSAHFDDTDSDRGSRKKKALLRRFGDLLRRRSFHKKEPSLE